MPEEKIPLGSVALELTARCNQSCSFCYNAWRSDGGAALGELPFAQLRALIEKLFREASPEHITLTGGEPFLRPDLHEIIELINGYGAAVVIISNGGLIRQQTARRLAAQRVQQVQLSFAGADEATHDEVCGKNSLRRCVEAARLLVAEGVRVCGSFVCTKRSAAGAAEAFALMASLGIRRVAFNRFNPSGYGALAAKALLPTRSQVLAALAEAEAAAASLGLDITCTMPIPPCMIEEERYPHLSFGQCSAGLLEGELALGPDGQLKLCTLQKRGVGDFSKTSLAQLLASGAFEAFRQKIPAFCEGCPHASSCLGGCGASAEWLFDDAGEPDPFLAQHVMPALFRKLRGGQ